MLNQALKNYPGQNSPTDSAGQPEGQTTGFANRHRTFRPGESSTTRRLQILKITVALQSNGLREAALKPLLTSW